MLDVQGENRHRRIGLKLLAILSCNGMWCVSISEASQFRLIEALQLTLCLDETEDLNKKQMGEKRSLLLGGCEKGSRVYRTDRRGDQFIPRAYNNYSPRALANIEGLEDILGSRTVKINRFPLKRNRETQERSAPKVEHIEAYPQIGYSRTALYTEEQPLRHLSSDLRVRRSTGTAGK